MWTVEVNWAVIHYVESAKVFPSSIRERHSHPLTIPLGSTHRASMAHSIFSRTESETRGRIREKEIAMKWEEEVEWNGGNEEKKKKKKTRETFTWVAEKNKGALHSIANLYIGDILVYSYFLVYIDLRWSTGTNYIVHVVILFIYLFFISFIYSWQTSSFQFLFILG